MTREEYIERITGFLMPKDPALAARAREKRTLDGVYTGKSRRIMDLVHLAYARGVRRGASCAWEAQQPIVLRGGGDFVDGEVTPVERPRARK